jgi:hypothetical protein
MLYHEMLRMDADVLLRETSEFTKQECRVTALLLVRLAAVETRELYAPCGYASMWDYCLGELQMSEDAAGRRLWAARKCREFPTLFDALADGRIHLTAIHTLSAHLRADNVDELVTAATGRSKAQLLDWLASRFPRPAAPTVIRPVAAPQSPAAGPETTDLLLTQPAGNGDDSHAPARVNVPSAHPDAGTPPAPTRDRARLAPLNAEQVKVQFTMSRQVLDKMRRAMDLLGRPVHVPERDRQAM